MLTAAVAAIVVSFLAASSPAALAYDNPGSNSTGITVNQATSPPTATAASPYPSGILIGGATGTITNLTVTLSGIASADTQNYSALLVGPGGQSIVLLAGVGSNSTSALNITLDDSQSNSYSNLGATLPSTGSISMAPTDLANQVSGAGAFPGAPTFSSTSESAPTGAATLNNVFDGTDPNGTWDLYIVDDAADGGGSLSGWSIDITSASAQTINFTSAAPTPTYGDGSTYTPTATGGGSSNPVVFSIDSGSTAGACAINAGVVSFTGAGSCLIDANQAGDSNYTAAPQVQQTATVAKASQTISFTTTAPSSVAVNAPSYSPAATGGASGNAVTFRIDGSSTPGACSISSGAVSFTGVGTCVIDADQLGNGNYNAATTATQTIAVGQIAQAVGFTSSAPTGATVGGSTYTPTATGGGSGNPVTFSIDGSSTSGACAISAGTVSFTAVGTCVIDANQGASSDYSAAPTARQVIAVGPGAQAINFTTTAPATVTVGSTAYTPAASGGASGNPVIFTIDASSTTGACAISAGTVSFTAVGTCLIDANQGASSNYTAAPQVQQAITVQLLTSSTALTVSSSALKASVTGAGPTPTGTVTFTVNGTVVGTTRLSAGTTTLKHSLAAGHSYTVVARYSGDAAHAKSSASRTYRAPAPTLPPVKVTLKLSSSRPAKAGWWTAPVTVRFVCTRGGKPATPCHRPVRLAKSGRGQLIPGQRKIRINIDLGAPALALGGLNAGATYLVSAPKPACRARDAVSGISSCTISERVQDQAAGAQTVTFTARAVNGAGTATIRSVTVSQQQPGLIGRVNSPTGIYLTSKGRSYTVQVASRVKPLYLEGALAPSLPSGAHNFFSRAGQHHGVPLWDLIVVLPSGLPQHSYWNIGVQIAGKVQIIAIPD